MNEDMKLSKRQVQFLSGLFVSRANCLGFDRNTPVGDVANHARIHWDYIERKQFETDNRIKTLEQSNDILRQNVKYLESEIKEMGERNARKDNWNKYKRCEAMVEICRYRKNLDEDRYPSFMHGGYGWTNYRFWDSWQHKWLALAEKFKNNM